MTEAQLAEKLVAVFTARGITLSTAESCTGGLIAKLVTDVPGSSAVLVGGCVSYTNAVKTGVLKVPEEIIARDTEVSPACAVAMAEGARKLFGTDIAVSSTGYAGPGGGTDRDPVGTVYLGVASAHGSDCFRLSAPDGADRKTVRELAAQRALSLALEASDRTD